GTPCSSTRLMRVFLNLMLCVVIAGTLVSAAGAQSPGDTARPDAPDLGAKAKSLFAALIPSQQEFAQLAATDFTQAFAPRFFLNYDLAYAGSAAGTGYIGAISSHGARVGRLLFYNEVASLTGGPESTFMRGNSGVAIDWPSA